MTHYIVFRFTRIIEVAVAFTAIRRICQCPYELSGSGGRWKITIDDEETCTKLELALEHMGVEIVAVDALYDGVEEEEESPYDDRTVAHVYDPIRYE